MGAGGFHTPGFSVRPATWADLDDLVNIELSTSHPRWNRAMFAGELGLAWSRVDVVETKRGASTTPVAFMVYWTVAGEIQLLNIATHQAYQRQGLATALMGHLVEAARAAAVASIALEVRHGNHPARLLYARFGFEEVGRRERYYGDTGEDALLLERVIR